MTVMHAKPFVLPPGENFSIEIYRCPNCSAGFGLEHTVAGPKYCPACGMLFGVEPPCTVPDLLKVLEHVAKNGGAS